MIRTTITMDEELTQELDDYMRRSNAYSRSEAIRELVRRGLNATATEEPDAACVGVVSYTINQTIPGLARHVRESRLDRHDEIISTITVPLNHESTVDIVILRGQVAQVNDYAQHLFLERGVKHGTAALIPVEEEVQHHGHGEGRPHKHLHLKVQETF